VKLSNAISRNEWVSVPGTENVLECTAEYNACQLGRVDRVLIVKAWRGLDCL
jgi:hypothetical protein